MVDRLVLIHARQSLSAVVCRVGFRRRQIAHTATVDLTDNSVDALAESVGALKRQGLAAGYAGAWNSTVFVCLAPDMALFHEWQTPSTSASVVRKAVSVLLEADFPCDTAELQHAITLVSRQRGKGSLSLSTSVRSDVLQTWHAALKRNDVTDCRISVAPWPILAGLPPIKEPALLLYVKDGQCVAAALGKRGEPLRLCALGFQDLLPATERPTGGADAAGSSEGHRHSEEAAFAATIRRECALVFGGLEHHPQQLLLYGDAVASAGMTKQLGDAFELPVVLLGRDMPLAGQVARLGETDSNRLLAVCLASSSFYSARVIKAPLFAARLIPRPWSGTLMRCWPLAFGVVCLAASWMAAVGTDGLSKLDQVKRLQANMQTELRKALPDAPRNASLMKLRTILRSRLSEQSARPGQDVQMTVLGFLRLLHAQVGPELQIRIVRLSYDGRVFRLVGMASRYEELTLVREALLGQDGVTDVQLVNAAYRDARETASSQARGAAPGGNVDFEMSVTWDS